jgi:alkylation response protein AidB-like acyl-CoA dehydrogenase
MDFAFSPEQEMLRSQARDFLGRMSTPAAVRRAMEAGAPPDDALWKGMVDLGWTAIPFAEASGGLGLGLVELGVVLEEQGSHLTPSPFHSTIGFGGAILAASPSSPVRDEVLRGVAGGRLRLSVAAGEAASGSATDGGALITAEPVGDAFLLHGGYALAQDIETADWIVVAAHSPGGVGRTLLLVERGAPGVQATSVPCVDLTRRLARVSFDAVEVPADRVLGGPGEGGPALERGLQAGAVAISAELCGVSWRAMEMSVEHARTRQQFGRPIGTYQAVSHRCADMLVQLESARSLTYSAAWAIDSGDPQAALAASMAKAYTSDAARSITASAIQVLGGIGFTWEHDAHLLFRRAKWGEVVLGDARFHRERVAQLLGL